MSALKKVTLQKTTSAPGPLPVGWTVDYTYTSAPREVAYQRALIAFKRDHPKEDIRCWVVA